MKHDPITRHTRQLAQAEVFDVTLFTRREWTQAAQYALDSGDRSELDYMTERTDHYHEFCDWCGDIEARAEIDFDDWLDRRLSRTALDQAFAEQNARRAKATPQVTGEGE